MESNGVVCVCVCARVGGINDINREHKCVKGRRDETVGKKQEIEVTLVHSACRPVS